MADIDMHVRNRVKIVSGGRGSNTKVLVDGIPLGNVTLANISVTAHGLVRATLELQGIELEIDADGFIVRTDPKAIVTTEAAQ